MRVDNDLQGCCVVVSGAAGGLGSLLLTRFLARGAHVIGIDKSQPTANHSQFIPLEADLSDEKCVAAVAAEIGKFGLPVEVLVNAAGVFTPDPEIVSEIAVAETLAMLWRGNVASAVNLTFSLREMLCRGRSPLVVNISSVDAVVSSAGQDCEMGVSHDVLYAVSKGAMLSLTKALAMSWAKYGIRVNSVCPSIFESPMSNELFGVPGKREHMITHIPLGRLCTSNDIADAVEALYSMKMTTGHLLPIDGGYLCR